ncbi:MAG: hypothetical protein MPJ08_00155 [Nitrosopumilus sp.]|nr:hypothetical protein [Nitrosopumilus sp.]
MVDLFVDIETVPDFGPEEYLRASERAESGELTRESDPALFWKLKTGSLTPFEGRTMLITYQVRGGHLFRLKEWEEGERAILKKFYDVVMDLQRGKEDKLRIIGHNVFGFDMMFLYNRILHHKINDPKWVYLWLIRKPLILDLLQMHIPLNSCRSKGLKHDALAMAYGLPTKGTSGGGEAAHYFRGEYDKVLAYSEREFVYPEMFARIESGGLVGAERLRECIKKCEEAAAEGSGQGASQGPP